MFNTLKFIFYKFNKRAIQSCLYVVYTEKGYLRVEEKSGLNKLYISLSLLFEKLFFFQISKFNYWSKAESKSKAEKYKCGIGFNCIVLKGVTIGKGAVVASGSVVTKDVAPFTVVAGNPAQLVKELKS